MQFWHLACGLNLFCPGTGSRGSMVEELERVDQVKNPWKSSVCYPPVKGYPEGCECMGIGGRGGGGG